MAAASDLHARWSDGRPSLSHPRESLRSDLHRYRQRTEAAHLPDAIADTVWVPLGSTVVIRSRFKEYRGKSVFHCHILPHEDTGMMANFLIL